MILRAALLMLALALALVSGSCGIPTDPEPRALDVTIQPATTPTPTTPPLASETVIIYLLDETVQDQPRVAPVERLVQQATPEAVIAALISGPDPDLDGRSFTSAITPQTVLLAAEVEGDTLILDFKSQVEGSLELGVRAMAQLTYTAAAIDGSAAVEVQLDGEDVSVPRGDGSATSPGARVSPADYPSFDPAAPLSPTPTPAPTPAAPEPTPTLAPAPTATPVTE